MNIVKELSVEQLSTLLSWGDAKRQQQPLSDQEVVLYTTINTVKEQQQQLDPAFVAEHIVNQHKLYHAPAAVFVQQYKKS